MDFSYYIYLPLMIIPSSIFFGSVMNIRATRKNWRFQNPFWAAAILYCIVSFAIALPIFENDLWGLALSWFMIYPIPTTIWIVLTIVSPQSKEPVASSLPTNQSSFPSSSLADTKKTTEQPVLPTVLARSTRIFVSYRRSDSTDIAGRIYDRLVNRFGRETVFKDVDSIPLGIDFKKYLDQKVGECDVLLAIIGDRWLDATDANGNKRLDDPADFVRIEIESALERDIPVVPLLVRGASMPAEGSLPDSLRKLVFRNGIPIRPDPDFHRDMDRLIAGLEKYVK